MVYESVFHNGDIQNSKTTIQKDNLFGLYSFRRRSLSMLNVL